MWLIVGLTLTIFAFTNLFLPSVIQGAATYIIQPLCWLFLIFIVHKRSDSLIRKTEGPVTLSAAIIGGFQIVSLVFSGFFIGFGKSPYQHTPLFLVINIFFFSCRLIGLEVSRAYLMKTGSKRHISLVVGLVSLFYAVLSIPYIKYARLDLNNIFGVATFLVENFVPAFAESLLATYLSLLGGPVASLSYLGILTAFEWLSPILPHPTNVINAAIRVMAPVGGLLFVTETSPLSLLRRVGLFTRNRRKTGMDIDKRSGVSWITLSMLCVIIVWGSTGLMGLYITTVVSGSMKPTIDVGDLIIVSSIDASKLQTGDVIQYVKEGQMVLHRIVEVTETESSVFFISKGDANLAPDPDPVFPEQIKGKLNFIIPKIGWISIYFKTFVSAIWTSLTVNTIIILAMIIIPTTTYIIYRKERRRSVPSRR